MLREMAMPEGKNNKATEPKVARIRAGFRQCEFPAKVGIAQTQLSEIDTWRRQPSPELHQRILRAMKSNQNGQ